MGRIFETRKATMFARWDKMSKAFSRIGKEVTIAVKKGGPDPANNPALRRVMQNARAVNMPKDKIEAAIKKASGQGAADYEERGVASRLRGGGRERVDREEREDAEGHGASTRPAPSRRAARTRRRCPARA